MLKRVSGLYLLTLFLLPQFLWSQGQTVTGKVLTNTGEGAAGASVKIKGITSLTTADANGIYRIVVPSSNSVLVFTMAGMQPVEMVAGETGSNYKHTQATRSNGKRVQKSSYHVRL